MKKYVLLLILLVFPLWVSATPVGPMSYQGRLLNNQGVPVTGSYNFTVRIYDDLVSGTLVYEEVHSNVTVNDGVYSFRVGTQTPQTGSWDLNLWQNNINDLYLELQVGGETLSPRTELTSAPHAFTATLALGAESLGGRSAAEYDNILEGLCVANNGKWLALAEVCAGGAVDLSGELWSDLDPDNNYSGVVFSNANLSNVDFTGVNFSGATFTNVDITNANFTNAVFTDAVWDGVTFSTAPNITGANLTNATLLNMDLTDLDLSTASAASGLAAAELSACPSSASRYPNLDWGCVTYTNDGAQQALIGPYVNLSANSPAIVQRKGLSYLSINNFDAGLLTNADFNSAAVSATFTGRNLTSANFSSSQLDDSGFSSSTVSLADFSNAEIKWTEFSQLEAQNSTFTNVTVENASFVSPSFNAPGFEDSQFLFVLFDKINNGYGLSDGQPSNMDFDNAKLYEVVFLDSVLHGATFSNAVLTNVDFTRIANDSSNGNFKLDGAKLQDVTFDTLTSGNPIMDLTNAKLQDVEFEGWNFYFGSLISGAELDGVSFKNLIMYADLSITSTDVTYPASAKPLVFENVNFWGKFDLSNVSVPKGSVFDGITSLGSSSITVIGDTVTLDEVSFREAYLAYVTFTNNTMYGVDFTGSTFQDGDFSGSLIVGANFTNAKLWDADFSNTDLRSNYDYIFSFNGADLSGVDFTGATFGGPLPFDWDGATCPDGFVVIDSATESCQDGHLVAP